MFVRLSRWRLGGWDGRRRRHRGRELGQDEQLQRPAVVEIAPEAASVLRQIDDRQVYGAYDATGNRLYVGTMDWSYIVQDISAENPGIRPADLAVPPIDPAGYGGDLWVFPSTSDKAEAVSKTGLGNYLNYGIRTMVPDGPDLYLGMADPMNLRTDPTDDVPEGGWELIKLTAPCT